MLKLPSFVNLFKPAPQPAFNPGESVIATSERGTAVWATVRYYDGGRNAYKCDYLLPGVGVPSGWFAESQLERFEIVGDAQ